MIQRYVGIDYGVARVGIALSDPLGITAQAYTTVAPDAVERELEELSKRERIVKIIVGLPLSMDGTDSAKTKEARAFAQRLAVRLGTDVELFDERLTTAAVERMLIEEADISRQKRKQVKDKLAAVVLLQSYLDSHPRLA